MAWRKGPLRAADWLPPADNPLPWAGLLSSLPAEHDYPCEVEGRLPPLAGTLYRVGPGLYDRGPDRRRMMLDGDGMVQALDIAGGRARYRNRFVRTAKFEREAAAGRFLFPTFSTHGSGPLRHNLGLRLANQANTTVLAWADRVLAFDEAQRPYALNGELETLGEAAPDPQQPRSAYWAHWKLDSRHRQLHLLSLDTGRRLQARILSLQRDGGVAARHRVTLPRSVYIHDWFVTPRYFAFLLHPAYVEPRQLLRIALARDTFASAIAWRPEQGGVLHVVDRLTGRSCTLETEACWMWHAINAWDEGEQLVLDFIAGAPSGGLGADDSPLFAAMRGQPIVLPGPPVNFPRRWRVDPGARRLTVAAELREANFELPGVSAAQRGLPHARAFMIQAEPGGMFARSLGCVDGRDFSLRSYRYPEDVFCGEPVVCDDLSGPPGRWVISQVYDGRERRSRFDVFDGEDLPAGPVASIRLRHHVPLSFHGYWAAAPA